MTEPSYDEEKKAIDILKAFKTYGRPVALISVSVTAIVFVLGAAYQLWGQPVRRASILEFRPTFNGAAEGRYPNGLPFAPSDVTAGSVVDLVYDANGITEYCDRQAFRAGFYVEQRSDESAFLEADYLARLSEARLTPIDRQRLQAEYEVKRKALPLQYRLTFVKPRVCGDLPQVLVAKSLNDLLTTWASESEEKRGVLSQQVEVLTPVALDVGIGPDGSRLLKADLLRTVLRRVVRNIETVEQLPGSALIRFGKERLSFLEVHDKLSDLVRSQLEPLVVTSGRSLVSESRVWVDETIASAVRDQRAAEQRAQAYQQALREYSGQAMTAQSSRGTLLGAPDNSTDVQTISPQIDRTFIDRIVEMSDANTKFRQNLTQAMVEANVEAIAAGGRAAYYQRLLQSLQERAGSQVSTAEIDSRIKVIVDQGKALTKQFNDLYDEFSRVGMRAAAAMYQTDRPVTTQVSQSFTIRGLAALVAATFVVTLLLAFGFFVLRDQLRA